jgi:hypothetical protein
VTALAWLAGCELFFPDDFVSSGDGGGARVDAADAGDGGAAGAIPCAQATGAFLCEDFEEDGGLAANLWSKFDLSDGAHRAVDSTRYRSGQHSLHTWTDAVPGNARTPNLFASIEAHKNFPSPVYVRVFVSLPSAAPQALEQFLVMQPDNPPYQGIYLGRQNDNVVFLDVVPKPPVTGNATPFPAGQWTDQWICVEWAITTGPSGSVQTYINSQPANSQPAITIQSAEVPPFSPGILTLGIGFYPAASGQSQFDVWFDDLYVDTQRVGCDK